MHAYRIQIEGAQQAGFDCEPGDTILQAALRAGTGLPYECNSGGCGSCQIELASGEVAELWPEAPGLSPRARERGRRLACQCVPAGDCTIRVATRDPLCTPPVAPQRRTPRLESSRPLTGDMTEFRFRCAGPARFLPGQFAMLRLPGVEGPRAYSMCNLPNADGEWNFVIKRVPGGSATARLFDAMQPGDEVALDAPYGGSYLRTDSGRDIVCVAGGSGLSPTLSILRAAVESPALSGNELHLFYGGRGPGDICVPAILDAEPRLRERVVLHTAISDDEAPGAGDWKGERGFIHELVKKVLGQRMPDFDFYFCGPPPMTDAVHRLLLLESKVPGDQLYFDRFF